MLNVKMVKFLSSFLLIIAMAVGSPSLFSLDNPQKDQKKKQVKAEKKKKEKKEEKIDEKTVIHNEITVTATRPPRS